MNIIKELEDYLNNLKSQGEDALISVLKLEQALEREKSTRDACLGAIQAVESVLQSVKASQNELKKEEVKNNKE